MHPAAAKPHLALAKCEFAGKSHAGCQLSLTENKKKKEENLDHVLLCQFYSCLLRTYLAHAPDTPQARLQHGDG